MIDLIKLKANERLLGHSKRWKHTEGVAQTAVKLAVSHQIDSLKAMIAGYYHDVAKYDDIEAQKKVLDPVVIEKYKFHPVMYHAMAAARYLEIDFNIKDTEILDAIKYHVWGRPHMSLLEKIIFVSDSCEPNRNFEDCDEIFELAKKDIDLAVEKCMLIAIDYVIEKGKKPSIEQLEAYQYYKEVNRGKN